jgi:hypothetical protein
MGVVQRVWGVGMAGICIQFERSSVNGNGNSIQGGGGA